MEENPGVSVMLNKMKEVFLTNEETNKILENSKRELKNSKDCCNEDLKEVYLSAIKMLEEAYDETKRQMQHKHDDLRERQEEKQKILQRCNLALGIGIVELAGSKFDESSVQKYEDVLERCREALNMRNLNHTVVFKFIPNPKLKPKLGVLQLCDNLPSDFKLSLLTHVNSIAIGNQVSCAIEGELTQENLQHLEFCIRMNTNIIAAEMTKVEDKMVTFCFRPDSGGVYSVMVQLFGLNIVASPLSVLVPLTNANEDSASNSTLNRRNEESKIMPTPHEINQESASTKDVRIEILNRENSTHSHTGKIETKHENMKQIDEEKNIESKVTVVDVSVSVAEDEVSDIEEMKHEELSAVDSNHNRFDEAGDTIAEDTTWKVGDKCIARWEDDEVWYRAEVRKLQSDGVLVSFIDYGNSAVVTRLVNMFLEIPHTDKYDANVIPTESQDENQNSLKDTITKIGKESVPQTADAKIIPIEAGDQGIPIEDYNQPIPIAADNQAIPIVESKFKVGDICIARWEADQIWYNCVVQNILGNGSYLVIFVDYGNSEVVCEPFIVISIADIPKEVTKEQIDSNVNTNVYKIDQVISVKDNKNEAPKELVELTNDDIFIPSVGKICVARWENDKIWYNARVERQNEDGTFWVNFINYGNIEIVGLPFIVKSASNIPQDVAKENIDEHVVVNRNHSKSQAPEFSFSKLSTENCGGKVVKIKNSHTKEDNEIDFKVVEQNAISKELGEDEKRVTDTENMEIVELDEFNEYNYWKVDVHIDQEAKLKDNNKEIINAPESYMNEERIDRDTNEEMPEYYDNNWWKPNNDTLNVKVEIESDDEELIANPEPSTDQCKNKENVISVVSVESDIFEQISTYNEFNWWKQDINTIEIQPEKISKAQKHPIVENFPQKIDRKNEATCESWLFSVGDVCVVRWIEDGVFYNAIVTSVLSDGSYDVMFDDYGNTATVEAANVVRNANELPTEITSDCVDVHVKNIESSIENKESCLKGLKNFEEKPAPKFTEGQTCVARWAEDLVWYNGKIVHDSKDGSYLVEFVDYGNHESVESLYIVEDGSKIPITVDTDYIDENVDQRMRGTEIVIKHDSSKDVSNIELQRSSLSSVMKDNIYTRDEGRDAVENSIVEDHAHVMKYDHDTENVNRRTKKREKSTPAVPRPLKEVPSAVEQTANDISQTQQNNIISQTQQKNIISQTREKNVCGQMEVIHAWQPGDNCLALWSEDSVWYNAVVKWRNSNGTYTVTFSDYGNEEDVQPGGMVLDHLALIATGKQCVVDVNVNVDSNSVIPCSPNPETDAKPSSLPVEVRNMNGSLNLLEMVTDLPRGAPVIPAKELLHISHVNGPIGISVLRNKNILISSSLDNAVKLFNARGDIIAPIESNRPFKRPSDMFTLSTGEFVVRDDVGLQLFTEEGAFIRHIGQGKIDKCYGVTEDDEGHIVTINGVRISENAKPGSKGKGGVTDVGETDIFYIDRESGSVVKRIEMIDIIQDKSKSKCRFINFNKKNVYIVDLGLDCIYVLDTCGIQAVSFGSQGSGKGQFKDPAGLVVDNIGNIIIADSRNHRLQIFNSENEYVGDVQVDRPLNRPSGIYLDEQCKELYVLNYWGNSMTKYRIG